ncbi:MAG TPA: hypothetical protein VFK92_08815, partial [Burkholderiales bacterium]|nr:hypothetical protein [Burkholderiales bacterium]
MNSSISRRWGALGLAFALLALVSCGGGGGGSSTPPAPGSKLFVSDGGNHAIASIINAAPTLGSTFTIDRIIQGANTGLGLPGGTPSISTIPSMALDASKDRLFVATQGTLVTFDNASVANGNISPSRFITGLIPASGGGLAHAVNFYKIDVDKTNDRLYSVDFQGEVHIYNGISTL